MLADRTFRFYGNMEQFPYPDFHFTRRAPTTNKYKIQKQEKNLGERESGKLASREIFGQYQAILFYPDFKYQIKLIVKRGQKLILDKELMVRAIP